MKTYEEHNNNKVTYYSIKWLNMNTNKFDGDPVGEYQSLDAVMEYVFRWSELDVDKYNEEYKIIKLEETNISKNEVDIWIEAEKYNI